VLACKCAINCHCCYTLKSDRLQALEHLIQLWGRYPFQVLCVSLSACVNAYVCGIVRQSEDRQVLEACLSRISPDMGNKARIQKCYV